MRSEPRAPRLFHRLRSLLDRTHGGNRDRSLQRGQVLPIFVIMTVVILGGAALISDVAWWWTNEQRMQRAADAGALAGAVYLPGDENRAFSSALSEAHKNGYTNGQDGISVTPRRDPSNERKLIVDVGGDVGTHFARIFGMTDVAVSVTGAAEFVLPVPMGSPENYYGVFGMLNTDDGGTNEAGSDAVTTEFTAGDGGSGTWTATSGSKLNAIQAVDGVYLQNGTNMATQYFGDFGLLDAGGVPAAGADEDITILGIEVLLDDVHLTGDCINTFVEVHLWGNDGSNWSQPAWNEANDGPFLNTTPQDFSIGGSGSASDNAFDTGWTRSDLRDGRFYVRLRTRKGCGNGANIRVDQVRVRVHYRVDSFVPDAPVAGPNGEVLTPRGFWASMMTQGAETTNGDAFLPHYNRRTSITNTAQNTDEYYNYAIEMPPGSSNGRVYLFDPGFCAGDLQLGLGDSWAGNRNTDEVSTFYKLYEDVSNTPYYFDDDTEIASSGDLFRQSSGWDGDLTSANDSPGPQGCDAYHLGWYELTSGVTPSLSGGAEGRVYRLHATTFDSTDVDGQRGSNARNHFSIFVDAQLNGGTDGPRVYGIGAMGMFTQLPGGQTSEFYLAQIDEAHKGKTMQIQLWDAGDTNQRAEIEILGPTDSGWTPRTLIYSAVPDSYAASGTWCNDVSSTGTSIVTHDGSNRRYNGCWLTITIPLDGDYDAPQDGWWKIRYDITGSDVATDITTWQVALIGNPVHLVQE